MNCVREDLKAHITDVLVGEAEMSVKEQLLIHLETCASCRLDCGPCPAGMTCGLGRPNICQTLR